MVSHRKGKWYVMSADGSKVLGGPYDTEEEAKKRLREIEFFKHQGEHAESAPRISAVIGKRPGKDTTEIQAYIFPKEHWKSAEEVRAWLRSHDAKTEIRETEDSYRARQIDPEEFEKGSFRTIALTGKQMAELDGKWIEVFRAGNYGEKGSYSPQDLQRLAASYDPQIHEAPIVVGHPEADAPAYGWVEALRAEGDMLQGKLRQVDAGFEDLVKQGRFKTRSVALYNDLGGRGLYLRHLGFLGAQPPEVKGLKSVFHDEQAKGFIEIDPQIVEISQRAKEEDMTKEEFTSWFSEAMEKLGIKKKEEPAVKTFSEAEVKAAAEKAAADAKVAVEKDFAEKQVKAQAAADRKLDVRAFAETLKPKGKWIPAFEKMGLVEFMESLPAEQSIEFGEEGKKQKRSPYETFKAFLEALPKIVEFGERPAPAHSGPGKMVKFNESRGIELDAHSVALNSRADEIASEKKISFGEALKLARQEIGPQATA